MPVPQATVVALVQTFTKGTSFSSKERFSGEAECGGNEGTVGDPPRARRIWDGLWYWDGLWLDAVFESKWNPEESFKSCLFFGLRGARVEGPIGSLYVAAARVPCKCASTRKGSPEAFLDIILHTKRTQSPSPCLRAEVELMIRGLFLQLSFSSAPA